MIDIITNNPLISYFERLRCDYNLKTYKDIAQYLDISIGTVKNAYGFRTIFPSKRLTDHLSTHLNKKPEIVLTDIYKESFIEPCNEYIKIVIFSLTYHYGYNLFLEPTGYIRSLAAWLPFVQKNIQIYAPIRKNGHETKTFPKFEKQYATYISAKAMNMIQTTLSIHLITNRYFR